MWKVTIWKRTLKISVEISEKIVIEQFKIVTKSLDNNGLPCYHHPNDQLFR